MHDMKLTLECPKGSTNLIFSVRTRRKPTTLSPDETKAREVNPRTCELLHSEYATKIFEKSYKGEASDFVNAYDPLGVADTVYELSST